MIGAWVLLRSGAIVDWCLQSDVTPASPSVTAVTAVTVTARTAVTVTVTMP